MNRKQEGRDKNTRLSCFLYDYLSLKIYNSLQKTYLIVHDSVQSLKLHDRFETHMAFSVLQGISSINFSRHLSASYLIYGNLSAFSNRYLMKYLLAMGRLSLSLKPIASFR